MCKSPESSLNDTEKELTSGCYHSEWKSGCYSHIISIIHRTQASLICLICKKLIPNEKYLGHVSKEHQIEKITVCPLCGILDEPVALGSHINQKHGSLDVKERPESSFFNLLVSLNSKKHETSPTIDLNSTSLLPDFFVYQCLNCHQFFPSECSFSHNCWTYNTTSVKNGSDQKQQPLTNNNYFSPIFLKFNVSKVLNSKAFQSTTITTTTVSPYQNGDSNLLNMKSNESSNGDNGNSNKKFKSHNFSAPFIYTNQK